MKIVGYPLIIQPSRTKDVVRIVDFFPPDHYCTPSYLPSKIARRITFGIQIESVEEGIYFNPLQHNNLAYYYIPTLL